MGNKEDVTQSGVDTIKQRRTDMQSKDGRRKKLPGNCTEGGIDNLQRESLTQASTQLSH